MLAAGTIQHRADLIEGLDRLGSDADARALLEGMPAGRLQHGGSLIAGPDGTVLAEARSDETTLVATLDMGRREAELAALDTDGHYSRPDIFELIVDRSARIGLTTRDTATR